MHDDDDVSALPLEELRRRVYAQGADERDERWIRAAAELARRERASRPVAAADADADAAADAAAAVDADGDTDGSDGAPDADGSDADPPASRRPSRRGLVGAAVALLAVGFLAGGAVGAAVSAGSPDATSDAGSGATPVPGADAPPAAAGSAAASASPGTPALLGPDSTSDQRSRPVSAVFDGPQEDADRPPKAVRADVDPTSIRAVQTSVGLYAGLSTTGDPCLLVFPSGGAGVVTCASPDRVASDGLRIAWTTEFPSRNRDGSTGMITGDVEAAWAGDGLITLTTPDRILAY
ncbi:hypothetical protein ACMT9U_14635 [Clavibacter sp. Sh2036]|uniref:hypothetical protein n=1 Tax=Clavibacter sp. Sh2036 TaxID=3397677 RepID=UPI0039E1245E